MFLMSIPPLLKLLGYELPYNLFAVDNPSRMNLILSVILVLFSMGTILGYSSSKNTNLGAFLLPNYNYDRSDRMTFLGVIILTILSFLVIIFPLSESGFNIVKTIISIRFEGFFYEGLNTLRQFVFFAATISGAFLVYLFKKRREKEKVSKIVIWSTIVIFLLNILFSFIIGGKSFVVFPLGATLIANEICRKKINYQRILVVFVAISIVVISLQFFRTKVVADMEISNMDSAYTGLYFVVYDTTLLYIEENEKNIETELGEDFLNSFIAIIPRFLWPDKPKAKISAGNRFAQELEPYKENPGGKPPYGMAQWYVNFSWFGVFFGGLFTGWLLSLLQEQYSDFRTNPFSFVIMWHFVFLVMGPWPGGIHNTSLLNYFLYIFPLFIFKWLTNKKLYSAAGLYK
jgi:oligosaccharide repeat unit polymerase